jgi:hypothetical protein
LIKLFGHSGQHGNVPIWSGMADTPRESPKIVRFNLDLESDYFLSLSG